VAVEGARENLKSQGSRAKKLLGRDARGTDPLSVSTKKSAGT
jgi:hypothetical protein